MIIDEDVENYIINPEREVKIQVYNPNIRFQNSSYYNRFRHNIAFKNYRALISLNKKLESYIMEEDVINMLHYYKLIYTILYSNYYYLIVNCLKVLTPQTSSKVHLFDPHVS